jgi:tetratricopeptide (TPR) repeat protein
MRQAADLLEPMGVISLRSVALNNLGEVYFALGDLDAAAECYVQARDLCREIGGYVEGHVLHNLGLVYLRLHRLDEAIASFTEALGRHRAAGLLAGEASTLKDLAEARAQTGDLAEARVSLAAAIGIFEQIADRDRAAETASLLALLSVE